MSDRATVDFLAAVPFLEGGEQANLAELAGVLRRQTLREGDILWRQGEEPRDMVFIVDGSVSASLYVPGGRPVEIGPIGPGEMVGELAMLDGEARTMTVRATQATTVLALGRPDFAALLARPHPWALSLKRRLASLSATRLRVQLSHLAGSLGDEPAGPPAEDAVRAFADLEYCSPPDSRYLRRLATFNDFDPVALWDFLTSASYARCPAGRTLLAEGAPSTACYLTINGAVEKVIVRGNRRVRFGLAGPGKAFGYESLIDGQPSPLTAMTRERALLLVLPRDQFEQLFNGEDAVARVFLDLIQRDIVAVLRQTLRPLARQAWLLSVSPTAPA
jgi:CRP-like cAMP-binding protein